MKLLLFINSLSAGGAERVMAKLGDYFVEAGHDVTLLTQSPIDADHYPTNAKRRSIEAAGMSRNPMHALVNNIRRVSRLRAVIQDLRPDGILAFMPTANVLALAAARDTDTPVVVSERVHPPYLELSAVRRWLQRRFYPEAKKIVVLSSESADWYASKYGLNHTTVIPNSVNLPLKRHDPLLHPDQIIPANASVVLSVGRLVPQKQPELVIETFSAATDDHWHLVMIGSGHKAKKLEELAAQLGISERFTLLPRVGNVQDWYERASIYMSASRYEGFPNALLEAMACGCACLAFDCPTGPGELIDNEANGFLQPLDDNHGYRKRLIQLTQDEQLRRKLASAAATTADQFDDEHILPRWLEVMSEATG